MIFEWFDSKLESKYNLNINPDMKNTNYNEKSDFCPNLNNCTLII